MKGLRKGHTSKEGRDCFNKAINSTGSSRSDNLDRNTPCNIPNWFQKAIFGLDISILDFLGPVSSNGVENSLFKLTCELGEEIEVGGVNTFLYFVSCYDPFFYAPVFLYFEIHLFQVKFDLPDQIDDVVAETSQDEAITLTVMRSTSEVKKSLSRDFSVGASFKGLSFSGSHSKKELQYDMEWHKR